MALINREQLGSDGRFHFNKDVILDIWLALHRELKKIE